MPSERKRSLSQTGGRCELAGDPGLARALARCLEVDPRAKLPFTHGFHAYPARMHPETARRAVETFPGGRILDPFMGSGTVAVEAVRAGRAFTGVDVSRVPLEIAWARTRVMPPDRCRQVEAAAHRLADRAFGEVERDFEMPAWTREERRWYDPHTLREVAVLHRLVSAEGEEWLRRLLTVVLSSIVVKLSRQVSDSDVKPDLYHRPRPRGAAFRGFRDRSSELTQGLLRLSSDLYKRKVAFVEPELRRDDARTVPLPAGGYDLVLTSPPYAGTYDYVEHHARRYPLWGEDPAFARAHEIGSRRAPERYREDLAAALRNALGALAPGGRCLVLLGDGAGVRADALLNELAPSLGARVAAVASQRRRDWKGGPLKREHLALMIK
jgi:hypothetical protein